MPKLKTASVETKTAGDMRPGSNAMSQLFSFVSRIERLAEEKDSLVADIREVFSEVKGQGFDVAIVRKAIQRRRKDYGDVMESDSILELYEETLRAAEKAELAKSEDNAGD